LSSEVKVTVVCSTQDRASQNIKNNLLALRKWEQKSSELYTVFEFKNYRLVEIKDPLIYQDGLDRRMLESGFPASLLIFASKHRSKDARGESVMLDGKTINPEMVYEINIRAIKLNYEKAIEE
jgi:D-tyrosyl-tRNA(Tyr) deacylase